MSPDDIFAAQFWPWPDPAIKRDAQGRILFVNAAFLGLYGGRVEDWRGSAVGGWPAPQAAPYRFETRIPAADGSEQVYDWMEQTLADGNAFALARNVTVFTQAPDPDPAAIIVPDQAQEPQAYQDPPQHYETQTQAAQVHAPHQEVFEAPQAPAVDPAYAEQTFEAPIADAPAAQIQLPEIEIPNIEIPSDDAYAMTDVPVPAGAAPIEHVAEQAPPAQTHVPAPAPQEREFERRALPIENQSAVLGNNWRDAVIAKAVGVETAAEDAVPAVQTQAAADTAPSVDTGSDGGPMRILLAEDNAINALLTRTLLEADGHSVDTVEDGALAVDAMKTSKYDLIFMDMRMPNMDGLEATRKIRALPNVGGVLPIIALTANAFDDDRNACFDSGMNDFMTKPVSAEELSEKVRDWTSPEAKARLQKVA